MDRLKELLSNNSVLVDEALYYFVDYLKPAEEEDLLKMKTKLNYLQYELKKHKAMTHYDFIEMLKKEYNDMIVETEKELSDVKQTIERLTVLHMKVIEKRYDEQDKDIEKALTSLHKTLSKYENEYNEREVELNKTIDELYLKIENINGNSLSLTIQNLETKIFELEEEIKDVEEELENFYKIQKKIKHEQLS